MYGMPRRPRTRLTGEASKALIEMGRGTDRSKRGYIEEGDAIPRKRRDFSMKRTVLARVGAGLLAPAPAGLLQPQPCPAGVCFTSGKGYVQQKVYDKAAYFLDCARKQEPDNIDAYSLLAIARCELHQYIAGGRGALP